jgi:hypothetical protein
MCSSCFVFRGWDQRDAVDLCCQPNGVVVEAMQEIAAPPTRPPIAKVSPPREPKQE